jgi:hypothetical protein
MRRTTLGLIACAGLASLAGCDPRAIVYFLQPNDPTIPPPKESPSLKGKRVLIIASAAPGTATDAISIDRDLVRVFSQKLKAKIWRMEVVNPDAVWKWVESHPNWTDPAEVAEKHDADIAIHLEIEQFQLQNQGDLNVLQGNSRIEIHVYERDWHRNARGKPITDQPKEFRPVYEEFQETTFPKGFPIATDGSMGRGKFKNKFLQIVATECTWHFVEHSPEDSIEQERFDPK